MPHRRPGSGLPPVARLMSNSYATAGGRGHTDLSDMCCQTGTRCCMGWTVVWGTFLGPWLSHSQGLHWCPRLLLPLKIMRMLGIWAATWGHAGVRASHSCWVHADLRDLPRGLSPNDSITHQGDNHYWPSHLLTVTSLHMVTIQNCSAHWKVFTFIIFCM